MQNYLLTEEKGLKAKTQNGYFIGPTIIDNVTTDMESYKNEIFGPVLQIIEVENMLEGIKIINENVYGNGCCIFTDSGEVLDLFLKMLE